MEPNKNITPSPMSLIKQLIAILVIASIILIVLVFYRKNSNVSGFDKLVNRSEIYFTFEDGRQALDIKDPLSLESNPFKDSQSRFSIRTPKGWQAIGSLQEQDGVIISPISKEESGVIQIQLLPRVISSVGEVGQLTTEILSNEENKFKNPVFNKIYVGPRLAYRISENFAAKNGVSRTIEYYIISNDTSTYVVSVGWNTEEGYDPSSSIHDSVSTFLATK